jgi:ABC-type uncharacterized transport system permease subunit
VLAEVLFWPVLLAYGEAAIAYAGEARRPGLAGRLATWGVRIGWLAQTALLAVQAASSDGFPWTDWAGTLNLFAWLVVSAYLFWGCRSRFRLLGLAVMPLTVVLLALAYLGGGAVEEGEARLSTAFLAVHAGLVLVGFAGLTLAAALAGLYLWQERGLKQRRPGILRLQAPALVTLERLSARTVAISMAALTLGIAVGLVRLERDGGGVDALVALTFGVWTLYAVFLLLRHVVGWRGRRGAYVALAGLVPVLAITLGLSVTHFS